MITVAIIGILATIAVPNFQRMTDKARIGRAKAEMAGVRTLAHGSTVADEAFLKDVLGSPCTGCAMGAAFTTDPINWNASGADPYWRILGQPAHLKDPWGRPYILETNEAEFGPDDCRHDLIYSAGPDKIWEGWGNGDDVYGDDVVIRFPLYAPKGPGCNNANIYGQFGN